MRTPNTILRDKVYEKLTGNITSNGGTLKVYDSYADGDAIAPFIIIASSVIEPVNAAKDINTYQVSLSIEIASAKRSTLELDNITNQVMQQLIPNDKASFLDLTASNFEVHDTELQTIATGEPVQLDTGILQRNVVTVRYEIDEEK